jgi:DNA-binding LacI/PurR family transcriptional regulator
MHKEDHFMRPKSIISASDVAEKAGVSRSAVSRTFTEGASVSPHTRAKVLQAAEELGYHVNHLARGLTKHESGIVCLIVSDINAPYRSAMIREFTQRLQDHGKIAMLLNTDRTDDGVERALKQAISFRADASVILSGTPPTSIVDTCRKHGQRLVLINRDEHANGPMRINLDEEHSSEQAAVAFVRAGCEYVTFVNSEANTPSLMARERTFIQACKKHALKVEVERFGPTCYESGAQLAQRILTKTKRPDGVFCVTDLIGLGFMDACRHEFKMRIPEDLCLMGFDDIEQAAWTSYGMTTFRQPIEVIAKRAVEWLTDSHASNQGETLISLKAELVWRQSMRAGNAQ